MSTVSRAYAVGTSAVHLTDAEDRSTPARGINRRAVVQNLGTVAVYVGSADVTTATGLPVAPGGSLAFDLEHDDRLYAVSSVAGQDVRVLHFGIA